MHPPRGCPGAKPREGVLRSGRSGFLHAVSHVFDVCVARSGEASGDAFRTDKARPISTLTTDVAAWTGEERSLRIETDYEMAIIGANRAGLGVAGDAYAAGVEKIILFSKDDSDLARQGVAGEHSLNGHPDWHVGAPVTRLVQHDDHVEIHTDDLIVTSRIVVVAARAGLESAPPPYEIPQAVASRVHLSMPDSAEHSEFDKDADILVIGVGETAAEYCEDLVDSGHSSVVLSLPSVAFDRLATATRNRLREIESRMQATVLWHAHPTGVIDVGGVPMVTFDDRRTPDLIFDHIIFSLGPGQKAGRLERLGIELQSDPVETGSVVVLSQLDDDDTPHVEPVIYVSPGHAWAMIHDTHFPELEPAHDLEARPPLLRYQLAVNAARATRWRRNPGAYG